MKPLLLTVVTGVAAAAATAGVLLYVLPGQRAGVSAPQAVPQKSSQKSSPAPLVSRSAPRARRLTDAAASPYPPESAAHVLPTPAPVLSPYQGTVIAVRVVHVSSPVSPGAAILGGIAGAVVGHQIGNGRGQTVATVAGAIGGAFLGNHIGEQVSGHKVYDIVVRRDAGGRVQVEQRRYVAPGQRVRLVRGRAIPD